MSNPIIKSGKFSAGADLRCGANVVVNVAEEVVVGDRCVLPDNAYFEGRRVELGDDFFGYSWGHPNNDFYDPPQQLARGWLEVGRGRIDEEDAVLLVGSRCTFHDNRIDLSAWVEVGDDVGLSPEVAIYTHHYWMDPRDGWPQRTDPVRIGDRVVVGFRSTILAGAEIKSDTVVGAGSVVGSKFLAGGSTYFGVPARSRQTLHSRKMDQDKGRQWLRHEVVAAYNRSLEWRGYHGERVVLDGDVLRFAGCRFDTVALEVGGTENELTDDLRDFLFKRGLRFWTKRPFRKLPRRTSL